MAEYGQLHETYWDHFQGKWQAQLVGAYLMSNPHRNMAGLYVLPVATIANELGHSAPDIQTGLAELQAKGFCKYDQPTSSIYIRQYATYQIAPFLPAGDKRSKALAKVLRRQRKHPFLNDFQRDYCDRYDIVEAPVGDGEAPRDAASEDPSHPPS